jgi:enoyl-CoA hydratase
MELTQEIDMAFIAVDQESAVRPHVELQMINDIALVVLRNATRRNALTFSMWRELSSIFGHLKDVSGLSAVVIRGEGTVAFAAGADISEFEQLRHSIESATEYNAEISRALEAIAAVEVPTIAAIRGFAVGGGCELSHACDLRIAADDAQIGIPIGRLGVILGATEAKFLTRQLGAAGLKRVLLTARLFDAQESLSLRLVDEILPVDGFWTGVRDLLVTITRSRPVTVRSSILVADHAVGAIASAAFTERMLAYNNVAYGSAGLAEGYSAFLDKRAADFTDEKELF